MKEGIRRTGYRLLVGRVPGIREKYRHFRDRGTGPLVRAVALALLLWWNLRYYLGAGGSLRFPGGYGFYEKRKLVLPESGQDSRPAPGEMAGYLLPFDVISFDLFDTLLLRPFQKPEDLFYLAGIELEVADFRRLRMEAEKLARQKDRQRGGTGEVTLSQIWDILSVMTGVPREKGEETEKSLERKYTVANPYFLPVLAELRQRGKRLAVASDMYLDSGFLKELLKEKGLGEFEAVFVSCETGCSKWKGDLFPAMALQLRQGRMPAEDCRMVHVGDHPWSDVRMAQKAGFAAVWYENLQKAGEKRRPADMSALTGTMYAGLVNIRLHCGLKRYSAFYELGYVYGGLPALGYCRHIHRFTAEKGIRHIWFLARDGEVLKKVYEQLYPEEQVCYVRWSRSAAARLVSGLRPYDFFRCFLFEKADQGYRVRQIFAGMQLDFLEPEFDRRCGCSGMDPWTLGRARLCRRFLLSVWDKVQAAYQEERQAAASYLSGFAAGVQAAAAVDIGWAGSGAASLQLFIREIMGLPCRVCGLLAGTATVHSACPDTAEGFLFSGRMDSYFFSQGKNRDLWKFHNLYEKHNLYMELLFTSPDPGLKGFAEGPEGRVLFVEGKKEAHAEQIRRIQKGILDFAEDYRRFFPEFLKDDTGQIHGRDAYAPFLLLMRDRKTQKRLEASFVWDTPVHAE